MTSHFVLLTSILGEGIARLTKHRHPTPEIESHPPEDLPSKTLVVSEKTNEFMGQTSGGQGIRTLNRFPGA